MKIVMLICISVVLSGCASFGGEEQNPVKIMEQQGKSSAEIQAYRLAHPKSAAQIEKDRQAILVTIHQLQEACKQRDMRGVYDNSMLSVLAKEDEDKKWDKVSARWQSSQSFWKDMDSVIMPNGKVRWIGQESFDDDFYNVWLERNGLLCTLFFEKAGGRWFMGQPLRVKQPAYRFDTPSLAYESLCRASEWKDTYTIYEAMAQPIKSTTPFSAYEAIIWKRQNQFETEYERRDLFPSVKYTGPEFLKEEMSDDGKSCKLWQLDTDGKKMYFRNFVKEGNEWKWVPQETSFWHPKNRQPAGNPPVRKKTG